MAADLMKQFEGRYGLPIFEGYGLSETSPVASFNRIQKPPRPGSIGLPIYGVEMKVVDEEDHELRPGEMGEIVIRGHNVMKGYYKRPGPTAVAMRGGWFHTGDLGRMDKDGYFYIVDRKKDLIKYKGYSVFPREVEDVLYEHPAVKVAAVVGIPDEESGEIPKAFIVLKDGAETTEEKLIEFVRKRIASFKRIRAVEFRDELPMTLVGKVLKKDLRET